MAEATITQIRNALATQINTVIPALRSQNIVPGAISPPVAVVRPARGTLATYQQTFSPAEGATTYAFEVIVLVSTANDRSAQNALDSYLSATGANSVWAAVASDPSLGRLVVSAHVMSANGYGLIEWNGVEYLATTFTVQVIAA